MDTVAIVSNCARKQLVWCTSVYPICVQSEGIAKYGVRGELLGGGEGGGVRG